VFTLAGLLAAIVLGLRAAADAKHEAKRPAPPALANHSVATHA
jgi:hypothetical protein